MARLMVLGRAAEPHLHTYQEVRLITKSNKSRQREKPERPHGFPMFPHASGQWAKKVNRKLYYFGVWDEPDAALERLNYELPYLKAGKVPPDPDAVTGDDRGCTLRRLCNAFLATKESMLDAGELSPRTFRDYYDTCKLLAAQFGLERRIGDLSPTDFQNFRSKLAKRYNVKSLAGRITRCRVVFNYAKKHKRLFGREVDFGDSFNKPSAKAMRKDRNEAGAKLFTRAEILRILDATSGQMRAMCLLGLNCAFGNSDVATLPRMAIDLEGGWIEFPRVKTAIPRRIPLWKETIEAVEAAIESRPKACSPKYGDRVFLTTAGQPWVRVRNTPQADGRTIPTPNDQISQQFARLLKKLEIDKRRGIGFYTLRHCFETYAGESKDQVAVDSVMGHVDSSMAAVYRQRISDERLVAVTNHVRQWLFANGETE